jgi:uncharacterized protein YecE (DUF72 family)
MPARNLISICRIRSFERLCPSARRSSSASPPVKFAHTTVRLHGRNYQQWFAAKKTEDRYNFLYTPDQLEPWKERIEEISEQAERTFVVANNHYLGKAAANATELKSMLSGKKVKSPAELVKTYPEVGAFAAP